VSFVPRSQGLGDAELYDTLDPDSQSDDGRRRILDAKSSRHGYVMPNIGLLSTYVPHGQCKQLSKDNDLTDDLASPRLTNGSEV
jgi:hypothetical protein